MKAVFKNVAILGLGLIGGSIALELRTQDGSWAWMVSVLCKNTPLMSKTMRLNLKYCFSFIKYCYLGLATVTVTNT